MGRSHGITNQSIYTEEEYEFLMAVEKFKHETETRFPAVTEYLEILKKMGYRKQ